MTYKLSVISQHVQLLSDGTKFVARCSITVKGWIAHRIEPNANGGVSNVGEGVNCSKFINREDGAEQIAKALGL